MFKKPVVEARTINIREMVVGVVCTEGSDDQIGGETSARSEIGGGKVKLI